MAEATLNEVKTAQYQVNGNVRLSCNITTPDGQIWDTDFVVDPAREVPVEPLGGLQGDVERWVAANPDQILPFSTESPPPRNDPVWENAPPPPDPIPPPPDPIDDEAIMPGPPPDLSATEHVEVPADAATEPEPAAEGAPVEDGAA